MAHAMCMCLLSALTCTKLWRLLRLGLVTGALQTCQPWCWVSYAQCAATGSSQHCCDHGCAAHACCLGCSVLVPCCRLSLALLAVASWMEAAMHQLHAHALPLPTQAEHAARSSHSHHMEWHQGATSQATSCPLTPGTSIATMCSSRPTMCQVEAISVVAR